MRKVNLAPLFLILAGEAVFIPPFLIPRLVRPFMIASWGLTNRDFGAAFFTYGILAAISYFLGGPLADKFHPRLLISGSLVSTAVVSLFLVIAPTPFGLILVYGLFGITTILLLWGALIKTTHLTGGEPYRSRAMGILDGGRGAAAAAFASSLLVVVHILLPNLETHSNQESALKIIYFCTAGFLAIVAVGIWYSLKSFDDVSLSSKPWRFSEAISALKNREVWLLSLVILGAYCGYKSVDNYATFLVDVQGASPEAAAQFMSVIFWMRPVSALATGFLADYLQRRNRGGRFFLMTALLVLATGAQICLAWGHVGENFFYFIAFLSSAAFVFALRAIYFSVFGDLRIPDHLVGTATGIVSVVGFMPDIFYGLVTGYLIDLHPNFAGFQLSFIFTAACLAVGAIASYCLYRPDGATAAPSIQVPAR